MCAPLLGWRFREVTVTAPAGAAGGAEVEVEHALSRFGHYNPAETACTDGAYTVDVTVRAADAPEPVPEAPTLTAAARGAYAIDLTWTAPRNLGPAVAAYVLEALHPLRDAARLDPVVRLRWVLADGAPTAEAR